MKTIFKILAIIAVLPSCYHNLWAQTTENQKKVAVDSTGTLIVTLPTVKVEDSFLTEEDRQEYLETLRNFEKLKRAVEKVYPLAKACAGIINEVNSDLAHTKTEAERKKYMKKLEKELFKKYEKQIRSLTISQGKILIKLVNRECGASAFKLIQEYKSGAAAGVWQVVATFFGTNLKEEYNRSTETAIESIIRAIDSGNTQGWIVVKH